MRWCLVAARSRCDLLIVLALAHPACKGSSDDGLKHAVTCAGTFAPCGGDPTGTWDLVGLCVEGDLKSITSVSTSSVCDHATSAADLAMGGSVTYGSGSVDYDSPAEMTATISYSPDCAAAHMGGRSLDATLCTEIESGLGQAGPHAQAKCSYDGVNCNCEVRFANNPSRSGTFTLNGSRITEGDGTTYEFCVDGNIMTQRGTVIIGLFSEVQFKKR